MMQPTISPAISHSRQTECLRDQVTIGQQHPKSVYLGLAENFNNSIVLASGSVKSNLRCHRTFLMGSSFSSRRQLSVQQADSTTSWTDDGPHQLSTITEIPLIRNKKLLKICKRCRTIDFKKAFGMQSEYLLSPEYLLYRFSPEFVFFLGKLEKEASCILCRFFYSMRWQPKENVLHGEKGVYALRSYDLETIFEGLESAAYDWHGCAPSRVLCVLAGEPDFYEGEDEFPTRGHWIVPQVSLTGSFFDSDYAKTLLTALPFCPGSINYPLLQAWCERCDNHHETCASGSTKTGDKQSTGPVVRCIDCHTREVIEIDTSDRYLALSYVWGAQSAPVSAYDLGTTQTLSPSSVRLLPNAIPKLIEDAMIVVKRLGERYLWVDQYCIDQNNADEKHAQIENMASIYEGAYATIVAFSASDSASGLRGVNNLPRKPYPSVPQTKHPLSALRPSAINSAQLVASSVWMTRGWTYQEAILSRRLLIFTEYQVEFICSNAVWLECTPPQMEDRYPGQLRIASGDQVVNFLRAISPTERPEWDDRTPVSTEELFGYIEEYSGRHLSYQSDALNAIIGLFSRLSTFTYLGIPVCETLRAQYIKRSAISEGEEVTRHQLLQFFVYLTWYPAHASLLRRDAFPSWSWLGWEGRVKFPNWSSIQTYGSSAQVSVLWIPQQATNGNAEIQVPFSQFLQGHLLGKWMTSVLPHVSKYLWVEGPVIKMSFALEQSIWNGSIDESFVFKNSRPRMRANNSGMVGSQRISFRTCKPDSESQEFMHQRVMTKEWDCLLLAFRTWRDEIYSHFLILDQYRLDADTEAEDYHSVVGSAELHLVPEELNEQELAPGSFSGILDRNLRRKIKLG